MKLRIFLTSLVAFTLISCGASPNGAKNTEIISSKQAVKLMKSKSVILVDIRAAKKYKKGHIEGAINIPLSKVMINKPFKKMVADKKKIAKNMSEAGVANSSTLIIYDNKKNMLSARFWWTLKAHGHKNIKVVNGGFKELKKLLKISKNAKKLSPAKYVAGDLNKSMITYKSDIKKLIRKSHKNTIIIDARSQGEYSKGTIPGSILINYITNT